MLKASKDRSPTLTVAADARFAIVASEYNGRYVEAMLAQATDELRRAGARRIEVFRVPGAFEVPAVAARLAQRRQGRPTVILCLGVIFQGETAHARQIGDAVSQALARLQTEHALPVVHGVYLFDNTRQAEVRCLGKRHNRGRELGRTAVSMALLMGGFDRGTGGR